MYKPRLKCQGRLFDLRPESMTILTAVTDMITTTNCHFSALHHLTLCVCVSSLSDHRSFRRTILHGMMGDQGISSAVIPHGLGESICDMSLVWCGVIRDDLRLAKPIPCDLIQASISSFPPLAPPCHYDPSRWQEDP